MTDEPRIGSSIRWGPGNHLGIHSFYSTDGQWVRQARYRINPPSGLDLLSDAVRMHFSILPISESMSTLRWIFLQLFLPSTILSLRLAQDVLVLALSVGRTMLLATLRHRARNIANTLRLPALALMGWALGVISVDISCMMTRERPDSFGNHPSV